jgi:hypothetical protein
VRKSVTCNREKTHKQQWVLFFRSGRFQLLLPSLFIFLLPMMDLVVGRASSSPQLQWLAVTLAHSGFGQKNRGGWGRRKPDSGLSGEEEDSKK